MPNEIKDLTIKDTITNEEIKSLIYTISEKQVMLDSDVAMLYNYSTKRINETVSRNKQRFQENFCFQLTEGEYESLMCKFFTLKNNFCTKNSPKIHLKLLQKKDIIVMI